MTNPETERKFYEFVLKMRKAQREYFKTRNRNVLQRSIMLERIVDDMISEFYGVQGNALIELGLNFES